MTSTRRQRRLPAPRGSAGREAVDELRRMVLLLETAEVLELRARRTRDVAQVPVLLRRAEHRRREAAELRERLAPRGSALPAHRSRPQGSPDSELAFSRRSPSGQEPR